MHNKYIPTLVVLLLLVIACQFALPGATPTPQVIYRSPDDMNLQPGDVPGLQETPVEDPATETILPGTEDQSQRAFKDKDRDIYVETNVILVTDPASHTYDDIYDRTVSQRRPGSRRSGGDKAVTIGGKGYLIPFSDDTCGQGLVLILIRSNVVTVVITCGGNVDEDYILYIGGIIDGHVQAPPDGNVAVTLPPGAAVTLPPPGLSGDEQCRRFDLTREECANAGRHTYNVVNTKMTGKCQPVQAFTCVFNNNFSASGLDQEFVCTYSDGYVSSGTASLTKSGRNQYAYFDQIEGSSVTANLTITMEGLNSQTISTYEGGEVCESDYIYTRQ